jgi:hypothetical protein
MSKHLVIVDDFYSGKKTLRAEFDRRLGSVRESPVRRDRFVWDYWYNPPEYCYLRTIAEDFLPKPLFTDFRDALRDWAFETLGMSTVNGMWLSYYLNGCAQAIHRDPGNGTWAFVYSISKWDERSFRGGETLVTRTSQYPDSWQWNDLMDRPELGDFEQVPSCFGRLVIFDSRLPHGVLPVEGTLDPQDSRVVLHGWLGTGGIKVEGPAPHDAVAAILGECFDNIDTAIGDLGDVDGLVVARMTLDPDGGVHNVAFPSNTLVRSSKEGSDPGIVAERFRGALEKLRFPKCDAPSRVTVPLPLG